MKNEKIVFFGTDSFSIPALKALYESGTKIAAVVTKPDRPAGRGRSLKASEAKVVAKSLGLKVLQPEKLSEALSEIKDLGAVAGVAVSYGAILPKSLIESFPKGIINIHPSLLPKYRGPSPIETAILNGDAKTGVTLMLIDEGMDTGNILSQSQIQLSGQESKKELYEVLSKLGAQMLAKDLPVILSGQIVPKPQDENQATLTKLIRKEDGVIDWNKSARQIESEVRAYAQWPKSRTNLFGHEVTITQACVSDQKSDLSPGETFMTKDKELAVSCGKGAIIIEKIKPDGKNEMTGAAFLAGYKK